MTQTSHVTRYDPAQIFSNPTPKQSDYFGFSVALDGNKAAIFQPTRSPYGKSEVHLFDTNTGKLLHTIGLDTCINNGRIALDGDRLFVATKKDNLNYVTEVSLFDASNGALLQTFPRPNSSHYFLGYTAIVLDGDYVVIPGMRTNDPQRGSREYNLYIFNANTGELLNTISNPGGGNYAFGSDIDIAGDKILVGSPATSEVYLINTMGNILKTFEKPTEDIINQFGNSLAMDGDFVAIGNPDSNSKYNAFKVYLFSASTGELIRTFFPPLPTGGDGVFGSSIAIEGNSLLIGSWDACVAGEVYHFDLGTGEMIEAITSPFIPSGENLYNRDEVGVFKSIAIDGKNALIGAYGRKVKDHDGNDRDDVGEAYLYSLGSGGTDGGTESGTSYQIQSTSGFILTVSGQTNTVLADVQGSSNVEANGQKWTITEDGMIKSHLGDFALDLAPLREDPKQKAVVIKAIDPSSPTQKWKLTADGQLINKSNNFVVILLEYSAIPGKYFVDAFAPEKLAELPYYPFTFYEDTWQFIEI